MRQLPASASVISNNLYDVFGVLRYEQGSAQTPWRDSMLRTADEGFYQLRGGVYAVEISSTNAVGENSAAWLKTSL
jgi:hypothetical protein